MEKGVHIDHPGLTQADIDAWKLADIKLDEHIAISKVDTDAVVKLRANEATAYDSFITSKNSILGNCFFDFFKIAIIST